jgi:probable phosphomutase (TIGR03848 family)
VATILLIRHAHFDGVGKLLAGRMPGWRLSEEGRAQAGQLAERLAKVPLLAIYCSPLERAVETAELVAARHRLGVVSTEELVEFDFGAWSGRNLESLRGDERFHRFNTFRSGTRAPEGESAPEAQLRMANAVARLNQQHAATDVIAVVSHADPLRALIAFYLGAPLDLAARLQISPASVSVVRLMEWGPEVLVVNHQGEVAASITEGG